ncbi:hypothetical protein [Celerinatantimonas yamalensis]|uniref:Uncharacterized protein n=1 Tax=Celerinatantimonas yamalensis TaxID=559956 RepID=A0ABW9G3Q3_9GAMM
MTLLIEQGILALANVAVQQSDGWFQGHVGASILAGVQLLESNQLPERAARALKARLEQHQENHPALFEVLEPSPLATDFSSIVSAIENNAQQLSRSGHGVIYGALFLEAIAKYHINVSQRAVANIAQLLNNCSVDNWARYFGCSDYRRFTAKNAHELDLLALCRSALERSTTDVYYSSGGYFYTGERIHSVTHAHAILLLDQLGYSALAQQASEQLALQLELNDLRPESGLTLAAPRHFDLTDATIWEDDYSDEHQIKLAYSYSQLSQMLSESIAPLDNLWGAVCNPQ